MYKKVKIIVKVPVAKYRCLQCPRECTALAVLHLSEIYRSTNNNNLVTTEMRNAFNKWP